MIKISTWALLCTPNPKPTLVTLNALLPRSTEYSKELLTLRNHLKKKRLDEGLYKTQVAENLNFDEYTIHNWESGRSRIMISNYPRIISFLGYHPFSENLITVGRAVRIHRENWDSL